MFTPDAAANRREAVKPAEGGTFVLGPSGTKVRVPERAELEHADPARRAVAERQHAEAKAAAEAHQAEQQQGAAERRPRRAVSE